MAAHGLPLIFWDWRGNNLDGHWRWGWLSLIEWPPVESAAGLYISFCVWII